MRRIEAPPCQVQHMWREPLAALLTSHLETQHDVYLPFVPDRDLDRDKPEVVYNAKFSLLCNEYYPVLGCPGEASTRWNLRQYLTIRHPRDLVNILGEGVYPSCD